MSHTENKVEWCLRKAEKELRQTGRHRGIVRIRPDRELAFAHVRKAEHALKAVTSFRDIGFSDWSASAAFYTIYHCFLAIAAKHGYESRNQECTFALMQYLIDAGKIGLGGEYVERMFRLNPEEQMEEPTITDIREAGQYGIKTTIDDSTLKKMLDAAKTVLHQTKEIIEK